MYFMYFYFMPVLYFNCFDRNLAILLLCILFSLTVLFLSLLVDYWIVAIISFFFDIFISFLHYFHLD
jgi:hypothetical protein